MTRMQELITKYRMEIVSQNGVEGIRCDAKPSAADTTEILAAKPAILAELHRQIDERKAAKKAAAEAAEAEKDRLIESGEAKLAVVYSGSYLMDVEIAYVVKMSAEEQKEYREDLRGKMHYIVRTVASGSAVKDAIEKFNINEQEWAGCLCVESSIYYITESQKAEILALAADITSAREAAKKAQKEAVETDRAAKFAEASETGKPVVLRKWSTDCCDSREECSMDIVTEYAMPDGSTKTESHHTW